MGCESAQELLDKTAHLRDGQIVFVSHATVMAAVGEHSQQYGLARLGGTLHLRSELLGVR